MTRRISLLLLFAFLIAFGADAQRRNKRDNQSDANTPQKIEAEPVDRPKTNAFPPPATKHDAVYRQALQYGDYQIAAVALYYKLADDPDNIDLKDSLASVYFTAGYYRQAALIGREIQKVRPNNVKILELLAISYANMKMTELALETYEQLYAVTGSAAHLYQVCVNQFMLGRVNECQRDLMRIINLPDEQAGTINISMNDGKKQDVKAKAAAYNVLGMLYRRLKEDEKARQAFQSAAEADPDFELPVNNLKEMDKNAAATGK